MDAPGSIRAAFDRMCPLPDAEWSAFAALLTPRQFTRGDYLTREGQVEHHLYYLDTGATRHYFLRDGKEFTVDFHFPGDFVTAYYSFLTREPSEVSIVCLEDTRTTSITHDALQDFYVRHPVAERLGRLMAEYQYRLRLKKEMDLLSLTAGERYRALLSKNPALVSGLSVKHLSSYLGIQPESLSRIRKNLT